MSFAPNTENLVWFAQTYNIGPKDVYNFGLSIEHIVRLKSLLATEGYQLREGSRDGLALEHIQATLAYLRERNLFDTDIKTSVQKLFAPKVAEPGQQAAEPVQQANAPAEPQEATQTANVPKNERTIRELQALLSNFMSPGSPFRVIIDGKWGPLTDLAFKTIMTLFNLAVDFSSNTVEILRAISQRVVYIHCDDPELISAIPQNPFCIIHKDAKEYELTSDAILRRMRVKEELVRFPNLRSKEGTTQFSFNTFAPWFMLLNLQGSHEEGRDVEVIIDETNRSSHSPSEFVVHPKYVLEYTGVPQHIDVKLNARADDDVIAVMFSKSMKFRFTQPFKAVTLGTGGTFNFGDFFSQPPTVIDAEVQPLLKADFVKFFVVTKDFASHAVDQVPGSDEPSVLSTEVYRLLTAPPDTIVFTTLVGLVLNPEPTTPGDFKDRVEKLDAAQPILVKDDLQKNRWGGKSTNNGKQLTAQVTRDPSLGAYMLTLTVRSTQPQEPLKGKVAFFLSNIFTLKIRYETAVKGEAIHQLTASEAFTVGAYTEDGTMLELDLRQVEGLPPEFYYKPDELA